MYIYIYIYLYICLQGSPRCSQEASQGAPTDFPWVPKANHAMLYPLTLTLQRALLKWHMAIYIYIYIYIYGHVPFKGAGTG